LRIARRSEGGFGNSSEGGCGGATVAHAANISSATRGSKPVGVVRLMRNNPD
jgi:hypothetical protein